MIKNIVDKYILTLIGIFLCFLLGIIIVDNSGLLSTRIIKITGIDAVSYYAYLHSVYFDHDLDFQNELNTLFPNQHFEPTKRWNVWEKVPETGKISSPFAIGTPLLLVPFYCLGDIFTRLDFFVEHRFATDGYSYPYKLFYFIGILFYGFLGLLFSYEFCKKFFSPFISLIAVGSTWLASSAFYYTFSPISHALSMFAISLFILIWYKYRESNSTWHWFIIGTLAGVMTLVRWQDALFLSIPFFNQVIEFRKEKETHDTWKFLGYRWTALTIGFFIAFLPQSLVWKIIYGKYFLIPQGSDFITPLNPHLLKVLFSSNHGLFTWTPILLVGLLGLIPWNRNEATKRIQLLFLIVMVLQIYFNSIVDQWWAGDSFGNRRFISCFTLFAYGLAVALDYGFSKGKFYKKLLHVLLFTLLLWNLLFMIQYHLSLFTRDRGLTFHELVIDKFHMWTSIQRKQFITKGQEYEENKLYLQALEFYKQAVFIDPNHKDVHEALANIYKKIEMNDLSEKEYKEAQNIIEQRLW